jgi:hypothetical protein
MLTVSLPWPHRDLSPNSRKHWRNRASKAKVHRTQAFALTAFASKGHWTCDPSKRLSIGMQFIPPANRHYDLDNLIARMKSSLDGVADALSVNDRNFGYSSITLEPAQKPGRVVVTIQEAA